MGDSLMDRAKGLFGRSKAPAADAKPAATAAARKPPSSYHAVSVIPGVRCCAAAKEIEGRRFLSSKAPILPLKDCGRTECTCRYAHHEDRRVGPRRAREIGVVVDQWTENDRRAEHKRGRRKTDPR